MQSLTKKIVPVLTAALIFSFVACHKQSQPIPISGDLLKYFDYKVGTYWIMRDSISGRIDSFSVTNNQFGNTFNGSNEYNIGISISEYTNGNINPDSLSWLIDLYSNSFFLNIKSPKPNFAYITNADPLFTYPFTADPELAILPSFLLNGTNYADVAEIIQNLGIYAYDDWFYVNSDVGFIKFRISHPGADINYVWELLRSNIVR
jgi:hypothetical protein